MKHIIFLSIFIAFVCGGCSPQAQELNASANLARADNAERINAVTIQQARAADALAAQEANTRLYEEVKGRADRAEAQLARIQNSGSQSEFWLILFGGTAVALAVACLFLLVFLRLTYARMAKLEAANTELAQIASVSGVLIQPAPPGVSLSVNRRKLPVQVAHG